MVTGFVKLLVCVRVCVAVSRELKTSAERCINVSHVSSHSTHSSQQLTHLLSCTGYKFDMRIYVAATCMDPLRVYIYHDGLARFATEAYSEAKSDLK